MGCFYEINDTLVITKEQGFPTDVFNRERHVKNPVTLADVKDRIFSFKNKPAARAFQLDPVRVFFAENTEDGKWLFWGQAYIQSIHITRIPGAPDNERGDPISFNKDNWVTAGTYKVVEVYDPEYQKIFTNHEAPPMWNYFGKPISPADQITYQATFTIKRAKSPATLKKYISTFKKLANKLKALAKKESGTLHYDYFSNDKETVFSFLENYADSEAAIVHGANNGKIVGAMLKVSSVKLEVYGNASPALKKSLPAKTTSYFKWQGGAGK